jgi:hypothetical protein
MQLCPMPRIGSSSSQNVVNMDLEIALLAAYSGSGFGTEMEERGSQLKDRRQLKGQNQDVVLNLMEL